MEEATTYDMFGLEAYNLELFEGQLQLPAGADPSPVHSAGSEVVLDWMCVSSNDMFISSSPVPDIQHDSIWPDTNEAIQSAIQQSYTGLLRKSRCSSGNDDLKSAIFPEQLFSSEDLDVTVEIDELVEEPFDELESSLSLLGSIEQTRDIQYLTSSPTTTQYIQPLRDVSSSPVDVLTQYTSDVSVLQQVPYSPSVLDDELMLYLDGSFVGDSLTDPDKVFNILKHLSNSVPDQPVVGDVVDSKPLLSPMSPEDIESVLYDGVKCSPLSSPSQSSLSSITEEYKQQDLVTKSSTAVESQSRTTYETFVPETKKLKKKEQNKSAAHRYRQKKREEKGVVLSEVDTLQIKNSELKARVEELNREIGYLRGLIEEINK